MPAPSAASGSALLLASSTTPSPSKVTAGLSTPATSVSTSFTSWYNARLVCV
ncbi:hypothetical protein SPRG_04238 [Saprolegnia parasitica CBS 223.65]|uniref:Uncharacterized protein n=1 Tax=Saprolegnia parasitica (strain CBS 223.65) TaxID=695850 RepID=A0A067CK39_SAPPC|nr:hypothetical protein SPRG_04238 [Saprolegnia parasitica CBS 223.65]KDO31099.1 hypothetical protein SPRG_04238 [Saprolegnia parasitica CBS 223.65]|eukprot:XP_012198228.1 hypothetical protein SPRG_04238 [Saprolegnia parasitica CBS 223.65]